MLYIYILTISRWELISSQRELATWAISSDESVAIKQQRHLLNKNFSDTRQQRARRSPVGEEIYVLDNKDGKNVCKIPVDLLRGPMGPSGRDGLDGPPGLDGVPGIDGRNGRDGADGRDGKDGKDGLQGDRGPIGPAGPVGEMGRRGKQGLPGKQGPPGPAGICAYKATADCSSLATNTNNNTSIYEALLLAPTMIGQQQQQQYQQQSQSQSQNDANFVVSQETRQVSVNEGDTVQLSCQATGLPAPTYMWLRGKQAANSNVNGNVNANANANQESTICLDVVSQIKVNSFPGGQLPLSQVDRSQAGAYECIADNGVLPAAVKRIELDVNFAPTIRMLPSPAIRRARLNSNIQLECLVEANPSAFTIWTFNGEPLMLSSGSPAQMSLGTQDFNNEAELNLDTNSKQRMLFRRKEYTITESTGQLGDSGAHYSHLILNLSNIRADQFGHYECVSKNLLGQTMGHFLLLQQTVPDGNLQDELDQQDNNNNNSNSQLKRLEQLILSKTTPDWPLERSAGWPIELQARCGNCTTFGNEYRAKKRPLTQLDRENQRIEPANVINNQQQQQINQHANSPGDLLFKRLNNDTNWAHTTTSPSQEVSIKQNNDSIEDNSNIDLYGEETCKVEYAKNNATIKESQNSRSNISSSRYLDQFGKYVLHGSGSRFAIDWWSMDVGLLDKRAGYFVSSLHHPSLLFEFAKLNDFVKLDNDGALKETAKQTHELEWKMFQSSKIIYNGLLIYISSGRGAGLTRQQNDNDEQPKLLHELCLILHNLNTNKSDAIPLADIFSKQIYQIQGFNLLLDEPIDLGIEFKLSRIELAADEQGILLIVPSQLSKQFAGKKQKLQQPMEITRRLNVLRLDINIDPINTQTTTEIPIDNTSGNNQPIKTTTTSITTETSLVSSYLISRKLDWRMIGQLFAIDGVLYGIRDRHSYHSKLLFAFDLIKCKFLSAEYVNERQHLFTNHFGNTQMVVYQPNEPPRLQILDASNILECPLKLMEKQGWIHE